MAGGDTGVIQHDAGGDAGGGGAAVFPGGAVIPGGDGFAGLSGAEGEPGETLIPDLRVLLVPVLHVPFLIKVGSDGVAYQGFGDAIGQNIDGKCNYSDIQC